MCHHMSAASSPSLLLLAACDPNNINLQYVRASAIATSFDRRLITSLSLGNSRSPVRNSAEHCTMASNNATPSSNPRDDHEDEEEAQQPLSPEEEAVRNFPQPTSSRAVWTLSGKDLHRYENAPKEQRIPHCKPQQLTASRSSS